MRVHSVVSGSEDDAVDVVLSFGAVLAQSAPDLRQSILQDVDRGRRLEIDETLGYTLRLAAEHSLAAPTLELCFVVLNAISDAASPVNR